MNCACYTLSYLQQYCGIVQSVARRLCRETIQSSYAMFILHKTNVHKSLN